LLDDKFNGEISAEIDMRRGGFTRVLNKKAMGGYEYL
jgi:hypothetical protein